jgi:mannosyl-oligosaccharide alpha-1,2-mannosidase
LGLDLSEKIAGFMNPDRDLPMYKDKPYFAPKRTGPAARRRKRLIWVTAGLIFLGLLWWLSGGHPKDVIKGHGVISMHGGDMWKWVQGFEKGGRGQEKSKDVDWMERRERVKDAFIVSWDDYVEHGWGEFYAYSTIELPALNWLRFEHFTCRGKLYARNC